MSLNEGNKGTGGSPAPNNTGPIKSAKSGKAGKGGGKPPKGDSVTPQSTKRGQSSVGAGNKTGTKNAGPTITSKSTKGGKK
jgi:hypothetical protein